MSRSVGERYECEECGAVLVYEKPCPCPPEEAGHAEICCKTQMKQLAQVQ